MRSFVVGILLVALFEPALAQTTKRQPARRPAAKPVPLKTEPVKLECPSLLGSALTTSKTYCDVLTGRGPTDPSAVVSPGAIAMP